MAPQRRTAAPGRRHAVLVRCRLNRLSHVDRATGEPIRRYEHDHPGAMLHVDVKKLGNVPDGGGWRYTGRQQGKRNRAATAQRTGRRGFAGDAALGTAYVHTVIDDHSRVAYAEVDDDETAPTAIGVLRRAVAWFAARGVQAERVLSDNGSAYRSHTWRDTCLELQITHKPTRPYRPAGGSTTGCGPGWSGGVLVLFAGVLAGLFVLIVLDRSAEQLGQWTPRWPSSAP